MPDADDRNPGGPRGEAGPTGSDRAGRPVLFFSDVHLGVPGRSPDRVDRLLRLMASARGRVAEVFILGDLFDFWFEYRHAVPKGHFRFLRGLADLVDSGVPVTYLAGNHDFWVGSYLKKELGLSVSDEPIERRIQGRRIFLAHGDGLGKGDLGYRVLKAVLRSRLCIALYRALHPDLGIPLAYRVSSISRGHTGQREVLLPKLYRDIARPRLREGFDGVIMGHVHEPAHFAGGDPAGDFVIIGDWLDNLTYVEMEGGLFRLMQWNDDGPARLIASSPPPEAA